METNNEIVQITDSVTVQVGSLVIVPNADREHKGKWWGAGSCVKIFFDGVEQKDICQLALTIPQNGIITATVERFV